MLSKMIMTTVNLCTHILDAVESSGLYLLWDQYQIGVDFKPESQAAPASCHAANTLGCSLVSQRARSLRT